MSLGEMLVGMGSAAVTILFLYRWYRYILGGISAVKRNIPIRVALGLLPPAALLVIAGALDLFAAFDVIDGWIFFYLLLGLAWLCCGLMLMFAFFDLSWLDDALERRNPAAALALLGGGFGVTLIYSGANVGDGPGWWCVVFAGGLGLIAWLLLGILAERVNGVFRRITVERDVFCGIRTGCFLLASGLILARACAGDWTSFVQTVVEFADGWPVLLLAALFLGAERLFLRMDALAPENRRNLLLLSAALGILFVGGAVLALFLLPPLPQNPIYDTDWSSLW